ncbi:glycosyltransferase [Pseudemcibacter aquimaris]|uniref:glycosyltransferase n=1 Tax=Pseudemcibacter aquimaris TaxID=2857064 RepID=UPI002011C65F|nr:glycosyltransferase [Pseudemcibacter aquimaris]MCC3861727.1 glycosyltransferase [Pseudemcibacter aquimaris]WDU58496.1 glycosyltransferase [Pseudemcibacter aquimaris]
MKILFVTYRFPPYNSSGAVRCGKMAKYLLELGNDVKILTCNNQPLPDSLQLEVPEENVIYSDWWNINAPVEFILGGRKKVAAKGLHAVANKPTLKSRVIKTLGQLYKNILHVPDAQIGWKNNAVKAGMQLVSNWRPDIIYASAMPITSFLVAKKISEKSNIPWVGELRDLWTDSPYYTNPGWKKWYEKIWEKSLFSKAIGLTTITEHSVCQLQEKYNCPIELILNGYDPIDFQISESQSLYPPNSFISEGINILYAGMIYPGKRDPEPLLKAVYNLPEHYKSKIKIHFYGTQLDSVIKQVDELQLEDSVNFSTPIPYQEILNLQKLSDILLLLMWDNPKEIGTFTGKFFEYIGARRPIICIGGDNSPPAQLINERNLGYISNNVEELVKILIRLIDEKSLKGYIEKTPSDSGVGLTRKEQAIKLSQFLEKLIK